MDRPAGWVPTEARGPSFGITMGETIQLLVERIDIDPGVDLAVTLDVGQPHQIELVTPVGDGPLPADGIIHVRGVIDRRPAPGGAQGTKLQIRLGDTTGPVLAEAEPHVYSPLPFNVAVHICTVHPEAAAPGSGTRPTIGGAAIDVPRLFTMANAIWRPAGVEIAVRRIAQRNFYNFNANDCPWQVSRGLAGTEADLVQPFFRRNHCNVYFVRYMDASLGVGVRRDNMAAEGLPRPAVIVATEGSRTHTNPAGAPNTRTGNANALYQQVANDLAHEIGHFLTLTHAGGVNSPGRNDSYARRQLMHPNNSLPSANPNNPNAAPRFDDVGYGLVTPGGSGHRGCLLTQKQFAFYNNDGEAWRGRRRARRPNNVLY